MTLTRTTSYEIRDEIHGDEHPQKEGERSWLIRMLQFNGATAASLFALWFLFGIPAYLLFGFLFE